MKVTFLSKEFIDLGIFPTQTDLEILPEIGDFVTITDFLDEQEKEVFISHMESVNKLNMAVVSGRIWSQINGKNIVELTLHFENAE